MVGGEPVEIQLTLEDENPGVNTKLVIWGVAAYLDISLRGKYLQIEKN